MKWRERGSKIGVVLLGDRFSVCFCGADGWSRLERQLSLFRLSSG